MRVLQFLNDNTAQNGRVVGAYVRYRDVATNVGIGSVALVGPLIAKLFLPQLPSDIFIFSLFGAAFIVFGIIRFKRQGYRVAAHENDAHGKLIYQNTDGNSVRYVAPANVKGSNLIAPSLSETVSAWLSPVVSNKNLSIEFLGRTTQRGVENSLILTQTCLLAVMIVPEGQDQNAITATVQLVPADSLQKSLVNSMINRQEISDAADKAVRELTPSQITRKFYSFSIPLTDITSISIRSLGRFRLTLKDGISFIWTHHDRAATEAFIASVRIAANL